MSDQSEVPERGRPGTVGDVHEIDTTRATAARLYDFWLGGKHHYEADRNLARRILGVCPIMVDGARDNRSFLQRAVNYIVGDLGIRQIIDIGSGIPTQGNVHEIAQAIDPACRVVYVDSDNEAVVTSQRMLEDNEYAVCISANALDPDSILDHPDTDRLIDFAQPVGLLMVALLHFFSPAQNPREVVARYLDRLAPGSAFAASHAGIDEGSEDARRQFQEAEQLYGSSANPVTLRTRAEFTTFFNGFELVEPGITYGTDWRPTEPIPFDSPARRCLYAAVGLKP